MPSSQLYPEVIDGTNLGARFTQPQFLPIGIEGQADGAGTANVAQLYSVARPSEAEMLFGSVSSLTSLIKFLLNRGVSPVIAGASVKSSTPPIVAERQAVWEKMESDENIRLRLTDSVTQSDLVDLSTSVTNASLLQNKQTGFVGMATASSKATLTSAATALSSKRMVLVGPGVYDENGTLLTGVYSAALAAAEVAKNPDLTDDLDTLDFVGMTAIEKDAYGLPLFRRKVVSGSVVNDFEDLLQGGVSPLMPSRNGGVAISHLRTTFTGDGTFDALMTRLIVDQVFLDVKKYIYDNGWLRRGNTDEARQALRVGIEGFLTQRGTWIRPKTQSNGALGYNVQVISSADNRSLTITYEGVVVRNIQTIQVDARLEIPI